MVNVHRRIHRNALNTYIEEEGTCSCHYGDCRKKVMGMRYQVIETAESTAVFKADFH